MSDRVYAALLFVFFGKQNVEKPALCQLASKYDHCLEAVAFSFEAVSSPLGGGTNLGSSQPKLGSSTVILLTSTAKMAYQN